MQDSNTERMTHNVFEMFKERIEIVTLRAGDVISMGSPAGVGDCARDADLHEIGGICPSARSRESAH